MGASSHPALGRFRRAYGLHRESEGRGPLDRSTTRPPWRGFLAEASRPWALQWRRERVRYPLWYEVRPVRAFLSGHRAPSRFDVWWTEVP